VNKVVLTYISALVRFLRKIVSSVHGYGDKIKFVLAISFSFTDNEIFVTIFSFLPTAVHSDH
jgi:hypothetical protein